MTRGWLLKPDNSIPIPNCGFPWLVLRIYVIASFLQLAAGLSVISEVWDIELPIFDSGFTHLDWRTPSFCWGKENYIPRLVYICIYDWLRLKVVLSGILGGFEDDNLINSAILTRFGGIVCQFEPLTVKEELAQSVWQWIPPVCYIGEHLAKLNLAFMSDFTLLPQTTSTQNKQPDVGIPLTASYMIRFWFETS